MSKHVGRKERWQRRDAQHYVSAAGQVAYERNGWYALLTYRTRAARDGADGLPAWESHRQRIGPFRRPRNAMIALEREETLLRNRHGDSVLFDDPAATDREPQS